jgi:hypothetical protein
LRSRQLCNHSRTSQYFMEPQGSFSCSLEPSTGPYPEPDRSSPYHPILSLLRSILISSSHLYHSLPSGLFLFGFPTNILYGIFLAQIRATCHARLILLGLIIILLLGEGYKLRSSSLCSFPESPNTSSHFGQNILLNALFSTPSVCIPPLMTKFHTHTKPQAKL